MIEKEDSPQPIESANPVVAIEPVSTAQDDIKALPRTKEVTRPLENSKSIFPEDHDPHLVTWQGDNDPENPKNWPIGRKWAITVLLSFSGLICLISNTMLAPALSTIAEELNISQAEANLTMSVFVLAFAVGPMVLAPFTEIYGRRNVWLLSGWWYAAWSVASGFAGSTPLLLLTRLMSGFGSSADFAVNSPVLGDIWRPEQRGHSFAIANFLPLLGPAIGPILGGAITSTIGWRWCFWILAAADALLLLIGFIILPETYPPLLLRRKATKLTKETGIQHYTGMSERGTKLSTAILRPTRLLVSQPVLQLMSLFLAFNYGTLYFVLASYSTLWIKHYHESVFHSSLHYIAMVIGYTLATQVGARITDALWKHFKAKRNGQTAPEYRVPLMLPGNFFITVGLLWIGWAAEAHTQWQLVDAGALIFGCGIILSTQAMQQYVMECFPDFVSSASAASQLLRNLFAFGFPLFAPALFSRLGYGLGMTTLASIFTFLATGGPILLWFYGAKLRESGRVVL